MFWQMPRSLATSASRNSIWLARFARDFRAAAVFFFRLAISFASSSLMTISGSGLRDLDVLATPATKDGLRECAVPGRLTGDGPDRSRTIGDAEAPWLKV
jgi:hypothetical protein